MRLLMILTLSVAALLPIYAQDSLSIQDKPIVARITVADEAETLRVVRLGLDLMEYREGNDLIFMTTQPQLDELRASGWNVEIDHQLTAELPQASGPETFLGGYRTVEETYAFLNQMQTTYPNLARVFTFGQSWAKTRNTANGYDMTGISLTNQTLRGSKPVFYLQAGLHARELVPPEIATRFIQYLLSNYGIDADATWILNETEIIVVPISNPDGRKIAETGQSKRKNMNNLTGGCSTVGSGIDLNRNSSFSWGVVNGPGEPPCGETFPGLSAASEPETQATQALVNSLFPDQRAAPRTSPAPLDATGVFLDMHSTGNLVLYPWGQDNLPPPNLQLRTISQKMASYNGYNPIQSIDLYPTSGTTREYAYGELGVAGITMEMGNGSGSCGGFMPAYSCLDGGTGGNFWNLNRPVLLYLAKLARTPYMTGEGPTSESLTLTRSRVTSYYVRVQISDQFNGNNNISAAEAYVDSPPWRSGTPVAMIPEDGSFNSPVEFATALVNLPPGPHIVYVRGRDTAGNWGPVKAIFKNDPTVEPRQGW